MIVLDVKFYSQVANAPAGMPGDWPVNCIEIDDSLPVTAGRTRMTIPEFNSYKEARQSAYDAWAIPYRASLEAAKAAAKDAAKPDQAALRDQAAQAISNNTDYLALSPPTNAQVVAQVRALTQQMNRVIRGLVPLVIKDINE